MLVDLDRKAISHEVRRLILRCARIDPSNEDALRKLDGDPLITQPLAAAFQLMSELLADDMKWVADAQHPGFVRYSGADLSMMAPFHLASGLPANETLTDLKKVASSLKIGSLSAIFLSGSAASLIEPKFFGDIDFCEYVPASEMESSLERLAALASFGVDEVKWTELKIGKVCITRPCNDATLKKHWRTLKGTPSGKSDTVAMMNSTGPIEATNIMLWVNTEKSDDDALHLSFPFQETRIDADTRWMPRTLARPSSVSRYVHFLRKQIKQYLDKIPVKALKRALSLSTFLMMANHSDAIREFGRRTGFFTAEAFRQRRELAGKLLQHPDPELQRIGAEIEALLDCWSKDHDMAQKPDIPSPEVRVRDLIGSLMRDVDTLAHQA